MNAEQTSNGEHQPERMDQFFYKGMNYFDYEQTCIRFGIEPTERAWLTLHDIDFDQDESTAS